MAANSSDTVSLAIRKQPEYCAKCHVAGTLQSRKLLRCTRCKVVRYCGRECQREHFQLHKYSCKAISLLEKCTEQDSTRLANAIVEMTYRSSISFEHGADGYAQALSHYLEANEYQSQVCKIPFLYAVLHCDEQALSLMHYHYNSLEETTIPPDSVYPRIRLEDDIFSYSNRSDWNVTHLITLLFIRMRLVASLQRDQDNFDKTFRKTRMCRKLLPEKLRVSIRQYVAGPDGFISQQRHFMEATRALIDPSLLDAIQHCIPLGPSEAPSLFDSDTPSEFWLLLQDWFFLIPGVNELLDRDE